MEIQLTLISLRELLFPNSTSLDVEKEFAQRAIIYYATAEVRVIDARLASAILAIDKEQSIFTIHKEGPAYTLWPTHAWRDSAHRKYLASQAFAKRQRDFAEVNASTEAEASYRRALEHWIDRLATKFADATQGMYKKKFLKDTMLTKLRTFDYDAARLEAYMGNVMSDDYFSELWIAAPEKPLTSSSSATNNTTTNENQTESDRNHTQEGTPLLQQEEQPAGEAASSEDQDR